MISDARVKPSSTSTPKWCCRSVACGFGGPDATTNAIRYVKSIQEIRTILSICVCDAYGKRHSDAPPGASSTGGGSCLMNNHSDNRQLLDEKWTRTPADVIRNDRTGITHLAVSHQDYTLCGISGLRRIRRHGLLILIKQLPMENAAQEATCHICKRRSSYAPL
jgi:hypothetical protein